MLKEGNKWTPGELLAIGRIGGDDMKSPRPVVEGVTRDGEIVSLSDAMGLRGRVLRIGWELPEDLSESEWRAAGELLGKIEGSIMWWVGDWWAFGELKYGERKAIVDAPNWGGPEYQTCRDAEWVSKSIELSRRRDNLSWSHHREVAALDAKTQKYFLDLAERGKNGKPLTRNDLRTAISQQKTRERALSKSADLKDQYNVIVIDPPWPMQKIVREVRPNQAGFDYETMDEDQLVEFWESDIEDHVAPHCHLFCWTTQRFLPIALRLLERWGFDYVCQFVWHKPGGFQPVGLPQFNAEFILYGRRGSPVFADTKNFPTCFNADRREHSRKPDEFYQMISRVCAGSRIDIFSREPREGFSQFGNEVGKFSDAAQ
jgi:N6-adenosine-specific RNA methylase IME4